MQASRDPKLYSVLQWEMKLKKKDSHEARRLSKEEKENETISIDSPSTHTCAKNTHPLANSAILLRGLEFTS